jgi:hypothetical protein
MLPHPTYSHFDLSTERYTEEPIVLLEDVTDTAVYSLGWSHKCSRRLESKSAMSEVEQTRIDGTPPSDTARRSTTSAHISDQAKGTRSSCCLRRQAQVGV